MTLFGASSHTAGAPGCMASSQCRTNGSSSYCTSTASAASIACALVSATTIATASPTWRALSAGSSMCGPMNTAPPPGPVSFMSYFVFGTGSCGMGAELVGGAVGAGEHRRARRAFASPRRFDRDNARMRIRRAHHHRVRLAVEAEIVGEAALAGDEPLVLLARQRLADEAVAGFVRFCRVVHPASLAVDDATRSSCTLIPPPLAGEVGKGWASSLVQVSKTYPPLPLQASAARRHCQGRTGKAFRRRRNPPPQKQSASRRT